MTTLDGCYKVDSIKEGPIYLYFCRVPVGTRSDASDLHRTAPMACTMLFISHPFGVIYRITLIARVPQW